MTYGEDVALDLGSGTHSTCGGRAAGSGVFLFPAEIIGSAQNVLLSAHTAVGRLMSDRALLTRRGRYYVAPF
jgi:hypothetical protein